MERRQNYEAPLSEELILYVENSICEISTLGGTNGETMENGTGSWVNP